MSKYSHNKRGSEWRKWDLHVHSPASLYQRYGLNDNSTWEAYLTDIEKLDANFAVIGVNDYFFIDGYERLKSERETNNRLKNIDCILPVLEFRIDKFAGIDFGPLKRINLHVIFSEELALETIKSQFLNTLEQSYYLESGEQWTRAITHESVEELGRQIKARVPASELSKYGSDLIEGFNNLNIREDRIFEALNKDCFKGKYLIAIGKTEWNDLKWTDASIATKKSIINRADIVFTAAKSIEDFHKAKAQLKSQGVNDLLLDCSDAHYLSTSEDKDRIGNCYTWIKANPNFEGLKQILYEQDGRVKIQALKPDVKNERHVISELEFKESGKIFGNQKLLLNENLNAIIGGKSSGKSLLLYSIAKSIDPEQVDRTSKRLGFDGYKFKPGFDFQVTWQNGDIDTFTDKSVANKLHKISYIPQLYINYLVEKNNKEELNALINNILQQDVAFSSFFEETTTSISSTSSEIEHLLNEYLLVRNKALETQKKSKEVGNSETIKKGIDKIELDIANAQKNSNLSQDEYDKYNKLQGEKTDLEKVLRAFNIKEQTLKKVLVELKNTKANLLGREDNDNSFLKGHIDRILDELTEESEDVRLLRANIETDFNALIANLETGISNIGIPLKKAGIVNMAGLNEKELEPFLLKLAGQKELQKLIAQLESEKLKHQQSLSLERQYKNLMEEYANLRARTASSLKTRYELYMLIEQKINETKKNIGSDILLNCSLKYKQQDFNLFEQTNKASLNNQHIFYTFFRDDELNYSLIPDFYSKFLRVTDDNLYYDADKFIPLKVRTSLEDVLRGLIKDSFYFDYSVTYKGDDLLMMSPGKKGTVLLILFLQISSSEYPILIDQPEDNLDNRTIYDLLCKMIKEKKKERQIVIVSHNANLVVATDAENIIVANQDGQGTEIKEGRHQFEYVNGALEYSYIKDDRVESELLKQGIKEHVCDILEGGNEAFKQREKKYAIKG